MTTATAKTTAKSTTVKKGQSAKPAAPVRKFDKGWTGLPTATTAAKAGKKPSDYYPQGSVLIKVLALPAGCGADIQRNHAAIRAALAEAKSQHLDAALATGKCTRRHVRRLARAGYLQWKAA